MGFTGGAVVKNLSSNAGDARDTALIHELGRSPGEGNPLEEVLANLWTVACQASPWKIKKFHGQRRLVSYI